MGQLLAIIRKLLTPSFIKFLFVAGINTCFGYLTFAVVVFFLKNVYVSVFVSTIIAILFNFQTYGRLVFKSKDHSRVHRFFGVYLFTMSLQMGFLRIFAYLGLTNPYIAGGILLLPMAGLSFLLMRKFVFKVETAKQ